MIAVAVHNVSMDKRKGKNKDRHTKKGFQMRLHYILRQQLDKLVEINASSISDEVRSAIRERLEKYHLWPVDDKK